MLSVSIIGAGGWGTALAVLLNSKGIPVKMWARRPDFAREVAETRVNREYLPGVHISEKTTVTGDLKEACSFADIVVFAVPSRHLREVAEKALKHVRSDAVLVSASKGIDPDSLLRMSEVLSELSQGTSRSVAVISGPNHAEEVARFVPSLTVVSSQDKECARTLQDLFMAESFRVYTNPDIVGVELGGALKNIIAVGIGIVDGLGFGDNTKAAFLTRGLHEIARLGSALGASPRTFAGLSGLGDLVVTSNSRHSRNRRAGVALGQGQTLQQILQGTRMVVEGVTTTRAAYRLAERHGVEMPITEQVHQVLFAGKSPAEACRELMSRSKKIEVEELAVDYWE